MSLNYRECFAGICLNIRVIAVFGLLFEGLNQFFVRCRLRRQKLSVERLAFIPIEVGDLAVVLGVDSFRYALTSLFASSDSSA